MLSYIKKILFAEEYVYEFDGKLFIDKDQSLHPIANLDDIDGAKKILTDFNNQAFARVIYIESQPKYAELLAKKKINDSGEFDDSIDLHVHKKQKVSDLTKLYCTPIPAHVLEHYRNLVASNDNGIVLSSIHDALWATIKKYNFSEPTVLVFTHYKSYEVLIASAKQVYFAGKFNAFEYDRESITSIWDVIGNEVKKIQVELSDSIKSAYLYHGGIEQEIVNVITNKLSSLSIDLTIPKVSAGKKHNLHLLMKSLDLSPLMGSFLDKAAFFFQKNSSAINFSVVFIALSLFAFSAYAKLEIKSLNESTNNKNSAIKQFKLPVVNIPDDLAQNIGFYQQLRNTVQEKQISDVFADLATAASEYVTINKLNFSQNQSISSIKVNGNIVSSFDDAYQSYKKMIASLNSDGYTVTEELFTTNINQSDFSFVLEHK